ncbi:MAG: LysM domain-containing protein [Alphaproteobacteria bacterium]|nr:MAG: LysM domain-containing protein [Alphaproteobacteria bacterium]
MPRMIAQMAKYSRLMLFALPAWAALACATPAHAGMLGWMDNAFTFRKEQKPLVAPQRGTNVPPKAVVQPYYPNDEHVSWSNFYTRTDLETQDYLSSSASKVMRPRPQDSAASSPAQAQGGWDAIAERAAENARAEAEQEGTSTVMIGEPGEGWGMQSGDSNVGRATRIGPAVQDWRSEDGSGISSRPGDYDYRAPAGGYAQTETPGIAIGEANPTAPRSTSTNVAYTGDDPRYVEQNGQGQVTKYKVQGGDTLSSISDQPAIYGNWKKWPLIYSANRGAIGSKPSNLKRDQRLQEADAIKRSGGR